MTHQEDFDTLHSRAEPGLTLGRRGTFGLRSPLGVAPEGLPTTISSHRTAAETVCGDEEYRLQVSHALQGSIDNMYRRRRAWAREDREAAETLRVVASGAGHSEAARRHLHLAARRLEEVATAQEATPRIFALAGQTGQMVEVRTEPTPSGASVSGAAVLRMAAELEATRISSFLALLNTPLADFAAPEPTPEPAPCPAPPNPGPTPGDIEGLQQSQAFLQTQLAEAEQVIRNLTAAVRLLQVNGHDLRSLDARLSAAVRSADELLEEYEPTDLATRTPRY